MANAARSFQDRIRAVAFTDSNHNVNWVKDDASLTSLVAGPRALYVRSHRRDHRVDPHPLPGETPDRCDFWYKLGRPPEESLLHGAPPRIQTKPPSTSTTSPTPRRATLSLSAQEKFDLDIG